MRDYLSLVIFVTLALDIFMVATTLYQDQANAQAVTSIQNQTITSIQNQTSGQSQSSICINDVCTNGTCTNNSCETSIKCINGKCEISSSATNKN
jgi:hypothetical protein